MRKAEDRGEGAARREGVAIAREILAAVRERVAGVMVSAPYGETDLVLGVLAP
jgi:hypothetical protein